MNYSFTLITTKADCQALITNAQEEKENLDLRKRILEKKRKDTTQTSVEVEADIRSTAAQIAALESYITSLPEGKEKEEQVFVKESLDFKMKKLLRSKNNSGTVAVIEAEVDIGCIDSQIAEMDKFIGEANTRLGEF